MQENVMDRANILIFYQPLYINNQISASAYRLM